MAQTLSNYLTGTNPDVKLDKRAAAQKLRKSGGLGSTREGREAYPEVKAVRKWEEFSRENLEKCFGGELGRALRTTHYDLSSSPISKEFCYIVDEKSFELLVTHHPHPMILKALEKTSRRTIRQEVRMTTGGKARLLYDKTRRRKPDFAGIKRVAKRRDSTKPDNILPGDAKPSWIWTSKSLEDTPEDPRPALKKNKGLSQVVRYCINASVRYGYILTDKELCVLRVYPNDGVKTGPIDDAELRKITYDNPVVDFISIPWSCRGDDPKTLTISIALWALHLLAANDGYLTFGPFKALEEEVLIDQRDQRTPPKPDLASADSSFKEVEKVPEAELLSNSDDDNNDDEENGDEDKDEDEDGTDKEQDLSIISPNISFQLQPQRNELPRLAKRKREVTEDVEGNIVVSSLRDRLRSRPTATM